MKFLDDIICGDCFSLMKELPDSSIGCIMSDLPYGTTYAPWDSMLPLDELWKEWKRILKPRAAVVLTASQPFTSILVTSNIKWFRCEWIWDKVNGANFANANRQPLKTHESVLIFAEGQTVYNPQKVPGPKNHIQGRSTSKSTETMIISERSPDDLSGMKFPKSIQVFPKHSSQCGLHPTQKPLELMRYFIKTYTNPEDVILDPCCGSGTTCLAAFEEKRHYIGFDMEQKYVDVAKLRFSTERKDNGS